MPTEPGKHKSESRTAGNDQRYDGLSVLFTTAPMHSSGDTLFTQFKKQNYIELLHHQMKTPLAERPVFLKSPRRVEALVTLLQIGLTSTRGAGYGRRDASTQEPLTTLTRP
jgi:hypothetical protein